MVATVTQLHSPAQEIERLQSLFAKQKAAFRHTPMPTAKARIEQLNKLKAAVIRHQDSIASAVNEDFSCRAKDETLIAEIMITVQSLNYMIKNVRKWMRPSRRHVSALFAPSFNQVVYQPLGVVGIMVPWNYPTGHRTARHRDCLGQPSHDQDVGIYPSRQRGNQRSAGRSF